MELRPIIIKRANQLGNLSRQAYVSINRTFKDPQFQERFEKISPIILGVTVAALIGLSGLSALEIQRAAQTIDKGSKILPYTPFVYAPILGAATTGLSAAQSLKDVVFHKGKFNMEQVLADGGLGAFAGFTLGLTVDNQKILREMFPDIQLIFPLIASSLVAGSQLAPHYLRKIFSKKNPGELNKLEIIFSTWATAILALIATTNLESLPIFSIDLPTQEYGYPPGKDILLIVKYILASLGIGTGTGILLQKGFDKLHKD